VVPLLSQFAAFKRATYREIHKQNLPAGFEFAMTDSGYINEDIFLELLQHLQKHRSPRKCLPMFNGHASHDSLKWATAEKMSLKCYAYLLT
jgi:hypothetical protein